MAPAARPVRYQGKIDTWQDARGFGFIAPNGGGPPVFLHIKAFSAGGRRPMQGDIVTYVLCHGERGQPQAELVAFARPRGTSVAAPRSPGSTAPPSTGSAIIGILGFFALFALLVVTRRLPALALALHGGMSVVAFILYGADKSAAQRGAWRTSEQTLITIGLVGGWPGALLAQGIFRHKSSKRSFQSAFRGSVALNCVMLAVVAIIGWRELATALG